MSGDPRVDVETAAEFFRAASEFDWTWSAEDVDRFRRVVGWEPAEFGTETTIVMTTNAQLDKPLARFELDGDRIHQVTIHLTDFLDPAAGTTTEFLADVYACAGTTLREILGQPVVQADQPPKSLWDKPTLVGELVALPRNVIGSVIRRDYPPIVDELQARGVW
ncbi:DUF6301 family protein [Nocardia callitridis]|uniref:SRPBCC family protein n=1 Tax=Nocardia callitridis TaxID=648753 RepID=A0ABP9KAC6_9NOCA